MTSRNSNSQPDPDGRTRDRSAFPLRLPPDTHDNLRLYAALSGKSMNDVVTRAVQKFLAEPGTALMLEHARTVRAEGDLS